jgi:NitT/TauT family transport system ATP-binding protein
MVFQHYTLYPWLNVQHNTEFGLKLQRSAEAETA